MLHAPSVVTDRRVITLDVNFYLFHNRTVSENLLDGSGFPRLSVMTVMTFPSVGAETAVIIVLSHVRPKVFLKNFFCRLLQCIPTMLSRQRVKVSTVPST